MVEGEFIDSIEEAFGKYKDGMRNYIRGELRSASSDSLTQLMDSVMQGYDGVRPPSLYKLKEIAKANSISLKKESPYYYVEVCENCGEEFPLEFTKCPHCGRKIGVGLVKKKYKDENYMDISTLVEYNKKEPEISEKEKEKVDVLLKNLVDKLKFGKSQLGIDKTSNM